MEPETASFDGWSKFLIIQGEASSPMKLTENPKITNLKMKPYQQIAIAECGEPLVPIPVNILAVVYPHPYQQLGADYGGRSPYMMRQTVVQKLLIAQNQLQQKVGWRLLIFDAYRPVAVQQFMVDHTYQELIKAQGLSEAELTDKQKQAMLQQVYEFWAPPSLDPATPPPHSTGAAVDISIIDSMGEPVNMGSPIDEVSPRSHPNYFATSDNGIEQQYHLHRQLLYEVMQFAGFARHPNEWWHFCFGDQMWAWLTGNSTAIYGRVA